jgi:hypothetical protein
MKIFIITLVIASVVATAAVIGLHHGQKVASAPESGVESSPGQTQPGKVAGQNQNGLGTAGFTFGIMGFIYGITALGQVSQLKKEVEKLKSQIDLKS